MLAVDGDTVIGEEDEVGGFSKSQYWIRASRSDSETWADVVAVQSTKYGYRLISWSQTVLLTKKNTYI